MGSTHPHITASWLKAGLAASATALVVTLAATGQTVRAQDKGEGRFSHGQHADLVKDCTGCHRLSEKTNWIERGLVGSGRGANEHRPCSNAGCHANQFGTLRAGAFCWTCHTGSLRFVKYPPFRTRGESDFVTATFSHQDHIRDGNKGCEQCHSLVKKKRRKAPETALDMAQVDHAVCGAAICHGEKVSPTMANCTACHVPVDEGQTVEARQTAGWDNYRVTYAFDHAAHARKSGEDDCAACHTNAAVGKGAVVPLPPMIACEGCHNGTRAFPALGHGCQRCHLVPEGER